MNIWVSIVPAFLVSSFTAYALSIRGHGRSTFRPETGTVEVSVPQGRIRATKGMVSAMPAVFVVAMVVRSTKVPVDWLDMVGFLGLMSLPAAAMLIVIAFMSRVVAVSATGIRVIGVRGWERSWAELSEITAVSAGLDVITFRFEGSRKAAMDSSFDGWKDLMKHLPQLTKDDKAANAKVAAAIRELNRWKPAAERY